MEIIALPLILSVGALVLYTIFLHYFIYKKDKSKLWSWINNSVISILSLIIGGIIAIYLFQYQNDLTDTNRKDQIQKLLSSEFNQQLQLLQNQGLQVKYSDGKSDFVLITQLQYSALNVAIESGLFDHKMNEAFSNLSQKILHYNTTMQAFINVFPVISKSESQLEFYVSNLSESKQLIVYTIDKIQRDFYEEALKEDSGKKELSDKNNSHLLPKIKVVNGKVQIDLDLLNGEWHNDIATSDMKFNFENLKKLEPKMKICKAYLKDNPYLLSLEKAIGYNKGFVVSAFFNGVDLEIELVGILDKDENGPFLGIASNL